MMQRPTIKEKNTFETIPFQDCPAKTFERPDGITVQGRSVVEHCQIVGEVARELVARYPVDLRDALFPIGGEFAAAAHDIGKVSPYFFEKIRQGCTPEYRSMLSLPGINPEMEREWGGHAGVSQVTAKALQAPKFVPEILGQHHGFSPNIATYKKDAECFGGSGWHQERIALTIELKKLLSSDWPQIASVPQARLVAGLTSVSDWIGSGRFFEDPQLPWKDNVKRALDEAGFVPPTYQRGLSFEQIFGFQPRPAQQQLLQAVTAPGVYVLEAPMGLGKTEAALYAAYRMLESGQASGIYFALPTQLTSNKIYERFNDFLSDVLAADCAHRSLLLHGNAWLLDSEMGEEGRPGGAWFHHAKRGLLAPFAVGTIDQALMAAMNVKHGFVRAFGLAGKVVILDEVHAYDAYTSTLLDALVALLRSLHCTVIILSATLTRERRQQLLNSSLQSDAYPLITAISQQAAPQELTVPLAASHEVVIRLLEQEKPALQEALDRAAQGQQILWIENTVADAQERYLDLAARASEIGVACGLLHSRFTSDDRHQIEAHWVNLFGKPGWAQRQQQGRILIGTQVLEQSLDIDSDFLISRFAPSDMVLQRLGRLWRHAETPRVASARCEAWLLAPDLKPAIENPQQAFGKTAFVYNPYVLCRSLEVWQARPLVCLPHDIRPLIEDTYVHRDEPELMARWLHELNEGTRWRKGRKALQQLARIGLAEGGNTLPEHKAQTRYSEMESHEVLLLRGLLLLPEEKASLLTLLDGRQLLLPWARHRLDKQAWRRLSATLMRQLISVREQDAPLQLPLDTLKRFGLQHCFYLGDPRLDEALLRVALVSETGVLQGVQGARVHDKAELEYRNDLGYRVIKEQK